MSKLTAFKRGSVTWEIFFGLYKTRHILLSDSVNCTVLRDIVLTQYRRVTDGQTDGIAVASTALAMRALRRAVKNLLSSDTSSTCPHNMVNFGELMAEIGSEVWGTPANFNGFCALAALLHGTLVVGVSQTRGF